MPGLRAEQRTSGSAADGGLREVDDGSEGSEGACSTSNKAMVRLPSRSNLVPAWLLNVVSNQTALPYVLEC